VSESVGSVAVAGPFLMDMVVKVLLDLIVVMATVDKVELVEVDSLRLHTSKKYSEISKGGLYDPLF
jgi:hypothetical protein